MQEQKNCPDFSIENSFNNLIVVGIDEAGRGPICGPVVAACVNLNKTNYPKQINDSKKLSKKLRQKIFLELKNNSQFGVGIVDEKTIDKINILEATKLAMLLAYRDFCQKYSSFPQVILIDGNFIPFAKQDKISDMRAVIKGDQKSLSIAAASIIAKETRDEIMLKIHQEFPCYNLDKNAGYPTKSHFDSVMKFGICKYHRRSFEPIKTLLKNENNF